MHITVLCKVVDNYGDIGVCWRMSRRLKKIAPQNTISLVVDDFETFSVIASEAKQSKVLEGVELFDWNNETLCHDIFAANDGERLSFILECFQCGRPDWMEKILFEEKLERTVQIIMIDYLTAEKYAEDFHCLKSLTRSAKVQKVNFMPGFTGATGGLIIDDEWESMPPYNEAGPVLVFTYTMGTGLIENTGSFDKLRNPEQMGSLSLSKGLQLKPLPYMNQPDWDKMMRQCSALIIRGEESMSRACLSGIPFIWQAYPQTEEYHLVKVKALLERMKPHFDKEAFDIVEKAWLFVNLDCHALRARNDASNNPSLRGANAVSDVAIQNFLNARHALVPYFQSFSQSLQKNGDLCTNLMTFINKIAII
ncbi:MAG: elongation factor P maturation arginine rhamnosyltransferase EarP [Treponema sp.]|nr:elongation factor P maturation arginine rhamnosyltransferase EarP [Treponema sp.]